MIKPFPKNDYIKKLRDPRWQKMRLKIMERDEYACRQCGDSENTLNVHHCYYDDKEPWDYESSSLLTLCEDCHKSQTESIKFDKKHVINTLSSKGMVSYHFHEISCAIQESGIYQFDDFYVDALSWSIKNEKARKVVQKMYSAFLCEREKNHGKN